MRALVTLFLLSGCTFAQIPIVTATVTSTDQRFLADGTSKVTTNSKQFYRDSAGRTRTESNGQAVISDPLTRTTIILNLNARTATVFAATAAHSGSTTFANPPVAAGVRPAEQKKPLVKLEPQTIAGVQATGFRAERILPPGSAAGNIQPVRLVSEFWESQSLLIPVSTTTTESNILISGDRITRKRTESYTNIATPAALDASLFTIPVAFQVSNSGNGQ